MRKTTDNKRIFYKQETLKLILQLFRVKCLQAEKSTVYLAGHRYKLLTIEI